MMYALFMKAAIVSPSAPSTHTDTRTKQYESGLATLKALGIECQETPHARDALSYTASSTKDRLNDLAAVYKDDSKLIITANGGWNASHLFSGLDFDLIKNNPKPMVGASDITGLLNAIYAKTGVKQIYGPMVTWGFETNDTATNESFLALAQKSSQEIPMDKFGTWLKPGKLEGVVVGGNLVSIDNLLGTPYQPDWQNKIFVWEETEETLYRLDRVLTHFKNAGVWDKIAGMVIGHLDQIDEDFAGKNSGTMQMITEHFAGYDFPILKTDLFGHNTPTQISLPIGGTITADEQTFTSRL
jgi:muramoyltetrapeptide carboxypeptidase